MMNVNAAWHTFLVSNMMQEAQVHHPEVGVCSKVSLASNEVDKHSLHDQHAWANRKLIVNQNSQ